jgi:hypothetical protein
VFWFSIQLLFQTFLILLRIQQNVVIKVKTSSCKVPVVLVRFSNKAQISNFIKIQPVGTELFRAGKWMERQMDMTKLTVAFVTLQMPLKLINVNSLYFYWIFIVTILRILNSRHINLDV